MVTPSPSHSAPKLLSHVNSPEADSCLAEACGTDFLFSVSDGEETGEDHIKQRLERVHKAQLVRDTDTEQLSTQKSGDTKGKTASELGTMETDKKFHTSLEPTTERDLSEQIKTATKDSHVQAENTELMLSFQRGQVTLPQYKLLLCSLHEIYTALEEEMDRNSEHPGVAPIYFPHELARLESIEKDLAYFYGPEWREKISVPASTKRYCHRLRQIGKENPELLVAHAYTRYLGDLSGGQVLGRIAQKSMGLKGSDGLSFFAFPGVSSPNLFKQLYRGRMNSIELTEEEKKSVLKEAVTAFELNIQVFDGLQAMLNQPQDKEQILESTQVNSNTQTQQSFINVVPLLRMCVGFFLAVVTVTMGVYVF